MNRRPPAPFRPEPHTARATAGRRRIQLRWQPLLALSALLLAATGCALLSRNSEPPDDWLAWRARRLDSIAGTNGWTTLILRHWLTEGRHPAGSSPTNAILLPAGRAPASLGTFIRQDRTVRFEPAPGLAATLDGVPVTNTVLQSDREGTPSKLIVGPLSLVVIERGERLGLRVRDPQSPARRAFRGLACFPYNSTWRLAGRYEPFPTHRVLRVPDVTGATQELDSPGAILFRHGGREHRLEVVEEPGEEDYFVIFRDETAGRSTYGSGRFLYVARPGADGRVTIDFNRAYTPPCGFTRFATCPLPPRQNWLPFAIPAGERAPRGH